MFSCDQLGETLPTAPTLLFLWSAVLSKSATEREKLSHLPREVRQHNPLSMQYIKRRFKANSRAIYTRKNKTRTFRVKGTFLLK